MEQPMLSLSQPRGSSCDKATPNVLPCRIQHDGPIGSADSYWSPSQEPDGKRVAYFRGRKLHGKALKVPEGYRGVVIEKTDPPKPQAPRPDEPEVVDLDAEEEMPLGILEAKAEFDEVVIWGHESVADASSDPYARGFEEWIAVAEQIHSYEEKGQ
ncbi:hypothetical protein J7T55_013208 [Diaporthe amygdali]|uniref:uncharacterized protein n=1 Tax=Phomopsis amygdali TaxID=1214568 RepID=UPI0022FEDE95|nr:uncharacterized protein J7T55_013208 [Diaporthe amygdali]KAJ0118952.1 hypothetical protein J7T55_013208 [Diaporthe amygdali]